MSSYEPMYGDELGAFLPGLTKIVKSVVTAPFKQIGGVTKAVFKPIGGIAKAVKFAAVGSKKTVAQPQAQDQSQPYEQMQYAPPQSGIPTVDIPNQQFVTTPQEVLAEVGVGSPVPPTSSGKSTPILLFAAIGAAAFYFVMRKRSRVSA
jgi:hypothetical protein